MGNHALASVFKKTNFVASDYKIDTTKFSADLHEDAIRDIWKEYNKDGDTLDRLEVLRFLNDLVNAFEQKEFQAFDAIHKHVLEHIKINSSSESTLDALNAQERLQSEWIAETRIRYSLLRLRTDKMWDFLDKDKNGEISFNEFHDGLKTFDVFAFMTDVDRMPATQANAEQFNAK